MDDAPTEDQIYQAAIRWCGEKDRETFPEDVEYFRHNWSSLPGLRKYVDDVVRADTLAERDALLEAGDALSFAAQTSGGVAGRDEGLVNAIDGWAKARAALDATKGHIER